MTLGLATDVQGLPRHSDRLRLDRRRALSGLEPAAASKPLA